MEGLATVGLVFGTLGLVAFVRLGKLIKTLKEQGILEEDYKNEWNDLAQNKARDVLKNKAYFYTLRFR